MTGVMTPCHDEPMTDEQIKSECEYYVKSGDAVDLNEAAEIVAPMCGRSWQEVFDIATAA